MPLNIPDLSRTFRHVALFAVFAVLAIELTPARAQGTPAMTAASSQAPIENRSIYFDNDGLIVHSEGESFDGGDTAQREGWYWLGVWLRAHTPGLTPWTEPRKLNFDEVLKLLEPHADGVFYRHPKLPPWNDPFSKEWGTSRDQLVPLIAAMGVYGKKAELQRLWDAMPDDLLGKHAFNGNWRNFLGQDGANCGDILKRGCDATASCPLQEDKRECSAPEDQRNCSLQQDTRNCSQPHDERGCNHWWGNDPLCESAKAAQNAAYAAAKGACEAAKAGQNTGYAAAKASCEAAKGTQNALYAKDKAACEVSKSTQNGIYAAQKASCETAKSTSKAACEVDKQASYQVCHVTNVYSGDILGPSSTNLFRRALDWDPMIPSLSAGLNTNVVFSGAAGEGEMLVDSQIRISSARGNKDDVGDDLNHIVHLVMAQLRYPTDISRLAEATYLSGRPPSYGSYMGAYYAKYGNDMTNIKQRIDAGIRSGWKPDVTAPYGAVRWYHRPSTGANPMLATLWQPIIENYMRTAVVK